MSIDPFEQPAAHFIFRQPRPEDASAIWQLIRSSEPLDDNSLYCNLLQCDHFSETCVIAERKADGSIVGWVSAYLPPKEPGVVFVWQVAVHPNAVGQGLGRQMLRALLARDACDGVNRLKATITSDNAASWALFASLARERRGTLTHRPHYRRDEHFEGRHATEHMVTIKLGNALCVAALAGTEQSYSLTRER